MECTFLFFKVTETVARRCSVKKMFFENLQNSQENTCAGVSFLIKLQAWHMCFPVNFEKFWKHLFLKNTSDGCFWSYCISSNFPPEKMEFAPLDRWNINILLKRWKFTFPLCSTMRIKFFNITERKSVSPEILLQRNSFVFVAAFNGYSFWWLLVLTRIPFATV